MVMSRPDVREGDLAEDQDRILRLPVGRPEDPINIEDAGIRVANGVPAAGADLGILSRDGDRESGHESCEWKCTFHWILLLWNERDQNGQDSSDPVGLT